MKNILILLLLFCSFNIFAQKGMKGTYTSKKVVTEASLIKNADLFDTFTETGVNVYYKQVTKKDGTKDEYYFIIVEKTRKDGTKYLGKKRIYPVFTSK